MSLDNKKNNSDLKITELKRKHIRSQIIKILKIPFNFSFLFSVITVYLSALYFSINSSDKFLMASGILFTIFFISMIIFFTFFSFLQIYFLKKIIENDLKDNTSSDSEIITENKNEKEL